VQEKVYQTHIANIDELKHRLVQVYAELDHRHIAAAIRQRRRRLSACDLCVKAQGDILTNICVEFTRSPLDYLLNSWPMQYLTLNFACRDITGRLTMQTSLGLPEDPII